MGLDRIFELNKIFIKTTAKIKLCLYQIQKRSRLILV